MIRVLRFATVDRLYALTHGALYQFDRNPPGTGAWAPQVPVPASATAPPPPGVHIFMRPAPVPLPLPWPVAGANLPDWGAYNDLAIHNPAAGPRSSLYLATSHPLEPLWWFDGQNPGQWHPARLGTDMPPAPPLPAVVTVPGEWSTGGLATSGESSSGSDAAGGVTPGAGAAGGGVPAGPIALCPG